MEGWKESWGFFISGLSRSLSPDREMDLGPLEEERTEIQLSSLKPFP